MTYKVEYIGQAAKAALSKLPDNYGVIVISVPPGVPSSNGPYPTRFLYTTAGVKGTIFVLKGMISQLENPNAERWDEEIE